MLTLLLNWRVWAGIGALVVLLGISAKSYETGKRTVQNQFDEYKAYEVKRALETEKFYQAKLQSLIATNQQVGEQYEQLKKVSDASAKSLRDQRLRFDSLLASRDQTSPSAPPDSFTYATTKSKILRECAGRLEEVAADADRLSNQVLGLQSYIREVVNGN